MEKLKQANEGKKFYCIYCKKEITFGSLRCMDCNYIWENGYKSGQESIKFKLNEIFHHLKNLSNIEE